MLGAVARMFVDGVPLESAGSDYFVLYGENSENFDFVVPPELDPAYLHTLGIEITAQNGLVAGCYEVFTVSSKPQDIQMSFDSEPVVINENVDLYYNLKFSLPVDFQPHMANICFAVNGIDCPELSEKVCISDRSIVCKMIPAKYVDAKGMYFSLTATLNPGSDPAIGSCSVTSRIPTVNNTFFVGEKVKPLVIPAQVMKTTSAYAYSSLSGYRTTLSAGTMVEYMNPDSSASMRSAKIRTADGSVYWVPMSNIYISRENLTVTDDLTDAEREEFVNYMGYKSPTSYLIWVNKQRQRLTVFMGSKGNWRAVRTFPVATGTNLTPTPTTVCTYEYSTRWVTDTYICSPVLSLYDGYAIHNQPISHSGYVTDHTIGKPASHGCIRMLQSDVNWVYAYVPVKTTVVLY